MNRGTKNAGTNNQGQRSKRAHIRVAHERKMPNGKIVYIKAVIINKELFDFEKLSIKERVKYCLYFSAPINNVEYTNLKPTTQTYCLNIFFLDLLFDKLSTISIASSQVPLVRMNRSASTSK